MNILSVKNFIQGWINKIEARSIPRGAFSDGKNWQIDGDKMILRNGFKILGTEVAGTGKINGIHTTFKPNGDAVLMRAYSTKLLYSTDSGESWTEIGTDILLDEDVTFTDFSNLAGYQVYVSSPSMGVIKIMTANLGSYTQIYTTTDSYRGYIKALQQRIFLWGREDDKTGLYLSHLDVGTNYTTITDEIVDTGDTTTDYSGTLAFKAAGAKRTCFGLSITNVDGTVELFTDNYDGTLTGSLGGTGTINYTSGAWTASFNSAVPSGNITATYQWEDVTSNGIFDFSSSATRLATEGDVVRQDTGGDIENIEIYKDIIYCIHERNTWTLDIAVDDLTFTNKIFRANVGMPYLRSSSATGDGIFLVDDSDEKDTKIRVMSYSEAAEQVIPISISDTLDLSDYIFDMAVMEEWGDYIVVACRKTLTNNDTLLVYNKVYKRWDTPLDYTVSALTTLDGVLIAGDSLSNNALELFSKYDDGGSNISNYVVMNNDNIDLDKLKRLKKFKIQGLIQKNQSFKIYTSIDNASYIEIAEIKGTGSYVDSSAVSIGSTVIGRKEIGGGSTGDAYNYETVINLSRILDDFEYIKLKFEARGLGYLSISEYQFRDIRLKKNKLPKKYI